MPDIKSTSYQEFLQGKIAIAPETGITIEPEEIHPLLKPHQRLAVQWAVRGGRRALFESFGLGKTVQALEIVRLILKHKGGRGLLVCPLGIRHEFMRDSSMLGTPLRFVRTTAEVDTDGLFLTNYDSIRVGKLDPSGFTVISLDEAAILRGMGGTATFRKLMQLYEGTSTFRFVCTATPSPNEHLELASYAAFLGIADVSWVKTMFFRRDATHADKLTLHKHKAEAFWRWCASWALFLQSPQDLCACECHREERV